MATLPERTFSSTFSGLKSTAITAGVVLVVGFALQEYLKTLRRYPEEDARRAKGEKVPERGAEGWAMGYLFRARSYVPVNPTVSVAHHRAGKSEYSSRRTQALPALGAH
jgi:hypothetical protein